MVTNTKAAEYIIFSNAGHEIQWITKLIKEILPNKVGIEELGVENNAEIAVMIEAGHTKMSKYIHIHYHHVQDLVRQQIITTSHVPTRTLQADAHTKRLP